MVACVSLSVCCRSPSVCLSNHFSWSCPGVELGCDTRKCCSGFSPIVFVPCCGPLYFRFCAFPLSRPRGIDWVVTCCCVLVGQPDLVVLFLGSCFACVFHCGYLCGLPVGLVCARGVTLGSVASVSFSVVRCRCCVCPIRCCGACSVVARLRFVRAFWRVLWFLALLNLVARGCAFTLLGDCVVLVSPLCFVRLRIALVGRVPSIYVVPLLRLLLLPVYVSCR